MTRKTKKEEDAEVIVCIICIFIIIIGIIIWAIITWWYIILPITLIMITIIYFGVYRDKKEKKIDVTKLHRLKGEKKVDWITRMTESANKYREMKIQMIERKQHIDRDFHEKCMEERRLAQRARKKICPNCNMELSIWNKCELCGWEKEICKREALGKKCFLKTDKNSCRNCGKYEKWDGKEQEKEKRSRTIPKHIQREVWRRDQGRCIECGSKERLEYDHIIPFSKGGSNTARNIQLLCERCNRKKLNVI